MTVESSSSSSTSVVLKDILVNCKILELRRAIARKVGRPAIVERGRLVLRRKGSFTPLQDGDAVGRARPGEVFLLVNADLSENPNKEEVCEDEFKTAEQRAVKPGYTAPVKPKAEQIELFELEIRCVQMGTAQVIQVQKTCTALEAKKILADFIGRPQVVDAKLLRRNLDGGGYSSLKAEEVVGTRRNLSIMGVDLSPVPGSPADLKLKREERGSQALAPPKPAALPAPPAATADPDKDPELVLVTVAHAISTRSRPLELLVMDNLTIQELKAALAEKLNRPEVVQKGRFVCKRGAASFAGIRDQEMLGDRRSLLYMGTDF